jgi:hypothetical protein
MQPLIQSILSQIIDSCFYFLKGPVISLNESTPKSGSRNKTKRFFSLWQSTTRNAKILSEVELLQFLTLNLVVLIQNWKQGQD